MKFARRYLAPAALLLIAGTTLPALAASSAASSASESLSTSVGSVSDSFKGSSESSTQPNRTADGDYRVVEVAALDERPGMLQLTLQPASGEGDAFALVLPQKAADAGGVAPGQVVRAQNRPYGVEFARADSQQPFFLVLEDDWYRELASNAVTL
ncbi:hypothetical protein [Ideonella sp.]|uniref:hypothetical protein n=1 Tax=Ideonella sp. TaxID=1929293 RepID=UPI002B46AC90|nr:hypothetical protein [Ideonella sp.]HJV71924.1 hypothetical protein [Ideonella sp.]